jgi:hypothetical protein
MTLSAYVPKKPPGHRSKLLGPRHVSCGSFLDYGPHASFAPSFDQEGVEIGREALGEVLWRWEDRKKRWAAENARAAEEAAQCLLMTGLEEDEEEQNNVIDPSLEESFDDDEEALDGLLSKEQIASLKSVLKSLELENAVQELLDRNTKALRRLEELQRQRLMKEGGFHPVEEGSEEWDTGKGILKRLGYQTYISLQLKAFSSHSPYWHHYDLDSREALVYHSFPLPPHFTNYIARSLSRPHKAGMVLYLQVVQQLFAITQHSISSPLPPPCPHYHQPRPLPFLQPPLLRHQLPQQPQLHRTTSTRIIMQQQEPTVAVISTSQARHPPTTPLHMARKGRPKLPRNTMLTSNTQHQGNNNTPTPPGTSINLQPKLLLPVLVRQLLQGHPKQPQQRLRLHLRPHLQRSQRVMQGSSVTLHRPDSAQWQTLSLQNHPRLLQAQFGAQEQLVGVDTSLLRCLRICEPLLQAVPRSKGGIRTSPIIMGLISLSLRLRLLRLLRSDGSNGCLGLLFYVFSFKIIFLCVC